MPPRRKTSQAPHRRAIPREHTTPSRILPPTHPEWQSGAVAEWCHPPIPLCIPNGATHLFRIVQMVPPTFAFHKPPTGRLEPPFRSEGGRWVAPFSEGGRWVAPSSEGGRWVTPFRMLFVFHYPPLARTIQTTIQGWRVEGGWHLLGCFRGELSSGVEISPAWSSASRDRNTQTGRADGTRGGGSEIASLCIRSVQSLRGRCGHPG